LPEEFIGKPTKVKVRTQLTANGIFIVEGAHAAIEEEFEEIVKEQKQKAGGAEGEMETVEVPMWRAQIRDLAASLLNKHRLGELDAEPSFPVRHSRHKDLNGPMSFAEILGTMGNIKNLDKPKDVS
jgi:hypothetical protein